MGKRSAGFLAVGEAGYPERLGVLQPQPAGLWVDGALPELPMLGIVGARAATAQAVAFSSELGAAAVELGWAVVSGGAFGVDAAAHEAALRSGGLTVAVLGCGVDIAYPQRHRRLFERIRRQGALISTLPLGTPPRSWHFPARNQILAALASAVVVVEAGSRSGSLSTAGAARRLGRPLYAHPGSPGTAQLLAQGATRIDEPGDLPAILAGQQIPTSAISTKAKQLHLALQSCPASLPELVERTLLSVGECAELLFELESCGKAWRIPTGQYQARD